MSIKGFSINGQTERYDYDALDNKPSIGNLTELETTDKSSLVAAINEVAEGGGGGTTYTFTDDGDGNITITEGT